MELTDLPVEIICEIANYLEILDITSFENILGYKLPHYVFIPKYKEIFDKSIGEINRINHTINSNGLGSIRESCGSKSNYETEYYNCNWDNMHFLTVTRVGNSYEWDDESYTGAFCGRQHESKRVSVFVYINPKKQGKLMTHYYEIQH